MRGSRSVLALVVGGLMLLSACKVEIDVATEVEEDGSGEIAVAVMLGETVRGTLEEKKLKSDDPLELAELEERGEDVFERGRNPVDVLEEGVPPGWEAERVTQGKIEGVHLRAEFASLDELASLVESLSDFGEEIADQVDREVERIGVAALTRGFSLTRDGSVFRFRAEPNVEEYEGATGGANNLLAEFSLSISLPGGVREHDADEKEDGTLVWRIQPGTKRTISATSDLTYNPRDIPWTPIGVGGSAVAIFGFLALASHRRRRSPGGDEPPGPAGVRDDVPAPI